MPEFFALVFALYWAMPWRRARVGLLLGASLYLLRLLEPLARAADRRDVADRTTPSASGSRLDASRSARAARACSALSLAANLGLLAAFKYADFFLASLGAALASCGVRAPMPLLRLMLPVGISFYTFEAMSYTVDVYRRRIRAERDPTHFLLFITFFPHLVAGPIVRARDFLPQVRRPKRWDWARAELGVGLFLMGLFKKLAIADRMALYADPVFADPGAYGSHAAWIATIAYAIQIYCDFSGYTDMALGSAHLLGYKLAPNFRMPYLSTNVGEFWRSLAHLALDLAARLPVHPPRRQPRRPWRTARNLLITMTLGGLWHGASWTFVLWGLAHGLLLVGHRAFRSFAMSRPSLDRLLEHGRRDGPPRRPDLPGRRPPLGRLPVDELRRRLDDAPPTVRPFRRPADAPADGGLLDLARGRRRGPRPRPASRLAGDLRRGSPPRPSASATPPRSPSPSSSPPTADPAFIYFQF